MEAYELLLSHILELGAAAAALIGAAKAASRLEHNANTATNA